MKTKLLHEDYVCQHLQLSGSHYWALTHHTGITLNKTSHDGDFMLLANSTEITFLEGCGLDLSECYADYFIVHLGEQL